ncbi:NAD(P)-dependent oxidoreductase [Xanthobacter sp. VNH20]|uniref:NAD(P)-dependent oxidoreductase n=1 Tax=Xanthobacter sp. VNH20 TaxID=3156616 RepID=UPI0032B382D7
MKIALVGASGAVGSRILHELAARGHQVTAIARDPSRIPAAPGVTAVAGDARRPEALAPLLAGHDAVVSSIHFTDVDAAALIAAVKAAGVRRYLVVGGAGSLEVAPGVALYDIPEFPAIYLAEAKAGGAFLGLLKGEDALDWTFLSPSADFVPGERTGVFRLGTDTLLTSASGRSFISYEDFAVALVDEIEHPHHVRARFTIGY